VERCEETRYLGFLQLFGLKGLEFIQKPLEGVVVGAAGKVNDLILSQAAEAHEDEGGFPGIIGLEMDGLEDHGLFVGFEILFLLGMEIFARPLEDLAEDEFVLAGKIEKVDQLSAGVEIELHALDEFIGMGGEFSQVDEGFAGAQEAVAMSGHHDDGLAALIEVAALITPDE
jgi:hypothetical protein